MLFKKYVTIFLALLLLVCTSSVVFATDCMDDNNISPVNGEFKINLDSNPSTGYHWEPSYDEATFKLISTDFIVDNPNLIGSPGTMEFTFKIIGENPTDVSFDLYAPDGSIVDHKVFPILPRN